MAHFGHQNPLLDFNTHPIIMMGVSNSLALPSNQLMIAPVLTKWILIKTGVKLNASGEVQF